MIWCYEPMLRLEVRSWHLWRYLHGTIFQLGSSLRGGQSPGIAAIVIYLRHQEDTILIASMEPPIQTRNILIFIFLALPKKYTRKYYMLNIEQHKRIYTHFFENPPLINVVCIMSTNIWYFYQYVVCINNHVCMQLHGNEWLQDQDLEFSIKLSFIKPK